MSTPLPLTTPQTMPWKDRGEPKPPTGSPRSARDLEILRGLARRINPHDAGAHNNLGVVYYNKGLYAEAVQHFERALELDPRMQVAERNLQIALFGTGFYEQHVSALLARVEAAPDDVEARDQLARAYFDGNDPAAAVRELRHVLRARPRDANVYLRLGKAELKRGDLEAALVALRNAAAIVPENARVHFQIGEVEYTRGRSNDARQALERALQLDAQLADAWHLVAFVYGDLGLTEQANHAAARAAQINPSYTKTEPNLSLDSYSTARYQELLGERRRAQAAPAVAEGGALAHYNLGLAFRQRALYDEALREFRLATERGEDSYLVQQAQAEMLLLRGSAAEARELYHRLLQTEAGSPKLWNELGVAHHQAGQLEEAEQAYRRALEIDPAYALAANNLAVVRHHRGGENAEPQFRSALEAGRAPADVWRNLALMLHRAGRREESADAYRSAVEAGPDVAVSWTGYGILLLEQGQPEEARLALLRAVEIDPQLAEARYHLAFALSALGDYQGALRETKLALELNPYIPAPRFKLLIDLHFEEASVLAPELDPAQQVDAAAGEAIATFEFRPESLDEVFRDDAAGGVGGMAAEAPAASAEGAAQWLESARTALERGELERATAEAQRAAMLGAERNEVLLLQGQIYLRRGLSGEAVERFNLLLNAIARSEDAASQESARQDALLGAARSLLDLGRLKEAADVAAQLCAAVPGHVPGLRTLGEALLRQGEHARAAVVLERARLERPDDVMLLTELGGVYAAVGDLEGAESALRRAVALDPHAAAARTQLAAVLAEDEREAEAESEYRAALRVLPSYGPAAFGLIGLQLRRGQLRSAIHVLVDLLTLDPYHTDALARLAELLERAGRTADAWVAWERVLRFEPHREAAVAAVARLGGAAAGAR